MGLFRRRDWKAIRRNMADDLPATIVKTLMWPLFPFVMLVFLLGDWKDRRATSLETGWDVKRHGYTAPPEDRV